MAKTLANLRARTRMFLDEATQMDWTDTQVDREINVVYMEVYATVVSVFEDYYSEKTTINTVANQEEYSLPTNLYKVRRVEINYEPENDNALARRALPISMDAVLRDLDFQSLGVNVYRNPAYYVRGTTIGLIPAPTQTATGAITLWYIKQISELSSDSDEVNLPFPDRYAPMIAKAAAGFLLEKGQQEEVVAAKYLADFELAKQKMMNELEDRLADGNKTIVDTIGNDVDMSFYSNL